MGLTTVNLYGILQIMDMEFTKSDTQYFKDLTERLNDFLDRACYYLKVDRPTLVTEEFNNPAFFDARYSPEHKRITIGICAPDKIVHMSSRRLINLYGKSNEELFVICLFHEVGHHWHYTKHVEHWNKFLVNYKWFGSCELKEYLEQHLERIADKIALILFKRLYLRG